MIIRKLILNLFIWLRRCAYILLGNLDIMLKKSPNIIVLCYHSIDDSSWRFSIKEEVFVAQINYMLQNFTHITPYELLEYIENKKRIKVPAFLITFDDGYGDNLNVAKFLKAKQINPVLFTIADKQNVSRESIRTNKELLSDGELSSLSKDGWIIGSHGTTHKDLAGLSNNDIYFEITHSKSNIEKTINNKVTFYSYPHGYYTNEIIELVRSSGYTAAFSTDDKEISKNTDVFAIPRVGVDATHSFREFKYLGYPSVIKFRAWMKKILVADFLKQ